MKYASLARNSRKIFVFGKTLPTCQISSVKSECVVLLKMKYASLARNSKKIFSKKPCHIADSNYSQYIYSILAFTDVNVLGIIWSSVFLPLIEIMKHLIDFFFFFICWQCLQGDGQLLQGEVVNLLWKQGDLYKLRVRLSSHFWHRIKVSKRLSGWFLQMINAKLFWLRG